MSSMGEVPVLDWKSHQLRRKGRSTLSAEIVAMCESTERVGLRLHAYRGGERS